MMIMLKILTPLLLIVMFMGDMVTSVAWTVCF